MKNFLSLKNVSLHGHDNGYKQKYLSLMVISSPVKEPVYEENVFDSSIV